MSAFAERRRGEGPAQTHCLDDPPVHRVTVMADPDSCPVILNMS
jgi:hypothetical protein